MNLFSSSRRKLFTFAFSLIATLFIIQSGSAWAQVGQIPGWPPNAVIASGGGPLVFRAPSGTQTGSATGTPTLPTNFPVTGTPTAFSIGTASSDRIVVAVIQWIGASTLANSDLLSVTGNGGAITFTPGSHYWNASIQRGTAVYYALVTSGTTMTITTTSVGGSGWWQDVVIEVGVITGSATASVSSTVDTPIGGPPGYAHGFTQPGNGTISVPTGGIAVISATADAAGGGGGPPGNVWSGTTSASSDLEVTLAGAGALNGAIAHVIASGPVSLNTTSTAGGSGWSSVSFQP